MTEASDRKTMTHEELVAENERLASILNTPLYEPFLTAVGREAAHQTYRWGEKDRETKGPADWFWLVGYLAGKALAAHLAGDRDKARHHTISTAAALFHWHGSVKD